MEKQPHCLTRGILYRLLTKRYSISWPKHTILAVTFTIELLHMDICLYIYIFQSRNNYLPKTSQRNMGIWTLPGTKCRYDLIHVHAMIYSFFNLSFVMQTLVQTSMKYARFFKTKSAILVCLWINKDIIYALVSQPKSF